MAVPHPRSVEQSISLAKIRVEDLSLVARIHREAFPKSVLSRFGLGAVQRYYHWQLTGPHDCLAIGAWSNNDLRGFCFAGCFRGALQGFLQANRAYLLGCLLLRFWLLADPLCRERVKTGVRRLTKSKIIHHQPSMPEPRESRSGSFGILSIAVAPSMSRGGIGRLMMNACEQTAREWGMRQMGLTVSPENAGAIHFYETMGWQRIGPEPWAGAMRKPLD